MAELADFSSYRMRFKVKLDYRRFRRVDPLAFLNRLNKEIKEMFPGLHFIISVDENILEDRIEVDWLLDSECPPENLRSIREMVLFQSTQILDLLRELAARDASVGAVWLT
jgi:hypothetical protein